MSERYDLLMDKTLTKRSESFFGASEKSGWTQGKIKSRGVSMGFECHESFRDSILLDLKVESTAGELNHTALEEAMPLSELSFVGSRSTVDQLSGGRFRIVKDEKLICESIDVEMSVGDVTQSLPAFRRVLDAFDETNNVEIGFCLSMGAGEQFFGGPEDPRGQIKNETVYETYNTDALGLGGKGRYQSTPVFWSSRGYLLAVLSEAPCVLDFGFRRTKVLEIFTRAPNISVLISPFDSAAVAFSSYRRFMGTVERVPRWSYGLWMSRCYYENQAQLETVLENAKAKDVDIGVINLDARAWMRADTRTDFVWDETRWESFGTFIPKLLSSGSEVCLWENPYVSIKSDLYQEGEKNGYFAKDKNNNVYLLDWVPDGLDGFPKPPLAGLVDFTSPAARSWWKSLHRPYIKSGVKAFKTDFGEEIPHDCIFSDGRTGFELRNTYSDLYNACVYEVLKEELDDQGIVWARSAFMHACSYPVKWNGDSQTTFRGLVASIRGGLSQACGGAIFWSHDSGGFYGQKPTSELYLRWVQAGLWSSHVRLHGTTPREPWEYEENVSNVLNVCFKVRSLLADYFVSEGEDCVKNATSFMRPLWLEEGCEELAFIEDQFYAGRSFIVAPYLDSYGGRHVYLPAGPWIDIRSGSEISGGVKFFVERHDYTPVYFKLSAHSDLKAGQLQMLVDGVTELYTGKVS